MSLVLPLDVAENVTSKETKKMIREGKQGHLQFTSRRRDRREEKKPDDIAGKEIRGEIQEKWYRSANTRRGENQ